MAGMLKDVLAAAGRSISISYDREVQMQLIKKHIMIVLLDSAVLAMVTGSVAFLVVALGI